MKHRIDIAMTAVIRPELLKGTLLTIKKYVMKKQRDIDFRLIINIDPIGEDVDPMRVVEVAQDHFKNIRYNISDKPSFPKAVKWVWSTSTAPYVFHWEDDMDILRRIDIRQMIYILDKYKDVSSLRLYKGTTPKKEKVLRAFRGKWIYNKDGFYVSNRWQDQFGLNPILIKQEFISEAVKRMVDHTNPEKQFRYSQKYMRPLIQKWKYAIFAKPGETRAFDGRKGQRWKNKMKLQKPKGQTFTEWVKR
jgi:hypothetical protein